MAAYPGTTWGTQYNHRYSPCSVLELAEARRLGRLALMCNEASWSEWVKGKWYWLESLVPYDGGWGEILEYQGTHFSAGPISLTGKTQTICPNNSNYFKTQSFMDSAGGPVVGILLSKCGGAGWIPGQGAEIPYVGDRLDPWAGSWDPICGGAGWIPGQGAEIPYASQPGGPSMEQKWCHNRFSKDFRNGPH